MSDATSDDSDSARNTADEIEPDAGDNTTSDHRNSFQFGRLVLVVDERDEWAHVLKDHIDREQFWPNLWFLSDHGTVSLVKLLDELAETKEREAAR